MSSSTLGNGVVETRGYNSDNTLSTISFGGNGTAIGNLTYTWDSNKNKTSETIGGVMSPYSFTQTGTTYDAEDRLTGFARAATSGTPQLSQSWNLSAVGDWNSVTTNGTAQSRTHGPTHELLTASSQSVTHDTKGNMLLIPASVRANSSPLVLTWDFDNRMVSADVGADSVIEVTHQYDALGRRVARTASSSTTVFVQVDQQTICDYVSGAAPASSTYRYLYGSYIDEPIVRIATSNSETTWYHRNQQYSIVACTDSSGAATERYAYTAYGLPTITDGSGTVRTSSAIGNRYTYTGREWDGVLGLYHYRARMFEATVGRFCSRDPIGYEGRQLNIYEFVDASPLVSLDPSGKRKVCCKNRFMGIVEMECADGNTARECCSDLVIEAVDAPCERRQNCWKSGSAKVAGCSLIVAAPTDPSDVIGTPVGLCVAGGATLVWLCCANEVLDLPKVALPRIPLPRLPNPTPTPKKKPLGPDWPAPPIENPKKNECPLCICHKANDSVEFYDKFTSKYSCENFPNTEKGKSEGLVRCKCGI
jgi:RHS repeat-associated protein